LLDGGVNLAFLDFLIFIVLISRSETLPREFSLEQVEYDIASALKIVSPALLYAKMSIG
jgi:Na+-transporting NADH:ubiquinone oxidoreductase subunit NqrE